MDEITSIQNPKIKQAARLRERRERDKTGLFLIEGYREILRAQEGGQPIERIFTCSELYLGSNEDQLIKKLNTETYSCSASVFKKISYRDRPDGLIAVAKQAKKKLSDLTPPNNALYIVAEAIEKPGNLGTILRSADAAGASGVIVCDRCTDIFNPNVIRASVGTLFTLPVVETTSDELFPWLKKHGIAIVAATPSAENEFTEVDLTIPIAIAVGTEQLGLSKRWMEQSDVRLKIPMLGICDSLNVATATTLLLYEAVRQRKR
ncbi:MAG: RNA methyltransferase [Waddliaceae bacterium]